MLSPENLNWFNKRSFVSSACLAELFSLSSGWVCCDARDLFLSTLYSVSANSRYLFAVFISSSRRSRLFWSSISPGSTEDLNKTFLGVPVVVGDQVIGVISVQSYQPNAFSESDLRLLST